MSFWKALGWLTVGAIAAVAVIAILSYQNFISWFQQRSQLIQADRGIIGVSIKQRLSNGNFKLVQGVFNSRTEQFVDARAVETQQLDPRIANAHDANGIAVWT